MIDHLFIKNYKAFDKQNIPLDKFNLLIGAHHSGKTTILEALDLFFNGNLNQDFIRNRDKDVVVEIHVDDERYRKTYSPPDFYPNFKKCIGDMLNINHIKYLYIKKNIDNSKLLNDILTINLTKKLDTMELQKAVRVFDYIDGILGNSNYPIFMYDNRFEMNINKDIQFKKEDYSRVISNITYQYLIIGIDNFEDNFDTEGLKEITQFSYQTIFSTNKKQIVNSFDYSVHALFKEDIVEDFETVRKLTSDTNHKTYLLVEGKYDVAWFEQALRLLELNNQYRVIPCGGFGNIEFINKQLKKEGFKTIVITDGDVEFEHALQREVIELYADLDYINARFKTDFKVIPKSKWQFFKKIKVKDDIVKKVLSSWARKKLEKDSDFVKELDVILKSI